MRGLDALVGNAQVKHRLQTGRGLSHAYILAGPSGTGKRTLGGVLSSALVCSGRGEPPCGHCPDCRKAGAGVHPDVIRIGLDGKDISVSQIRELRADAYVRPNEAARKVYVLENAQTMNGSAQNALLKLLEDGPAYAAFLLLTDNAGNMLATVRSRCVLLRLLRLPEELVTRILTEQYQVTPELAASCAAFCQGAVGQALKLACSPEFAALRSQWMDRLARLAEADTLEVLSWSEALENDKEHIQEVLRMMLAWFRDLLLVMETGETSRCICQDQRSALEKAVRFYEGKELYRKIRMLSDAQNKLQHNVNYALWSDWLLMQLARRTSPAEEFR